MVVNAILNYFIASTQYMSLETNALRQQNKDLAERATALRGYL